MEVEGEGDYIPILHCHHQIDFCIKMGSDESHFEGTYGCPSSRKKGADGGVGVQELCESGCGRPGLHVPNNPYGLGGRKATVNIGTQSSGSV